MLRKTLTEARKDMPEIFNKVCYAGERAIIQKHGKDCVAVVSIEDLNILKKMEDMINIRDAEDALRDYELHGGVLWDDVKDEIG